MKKIVSFIFISILALTLVACKKEEVPSVGIDLKGQEFVIMVDKQISTDPRLNTYAGMFKNEKERAILAAEEKYNTKIVFKDYPSNAPWGGARERFIINLKEDGVSDAHVYQIASPSVGTLAAAEAILPLDDLIETYGAKGYWNEKKVFGQVFGKTYMYDDVYTYSDDGLYYNSTFLGNILGKERALEPTEKYLAGEWDWAAFEALVIEINERISHTGDTPQYVMGGRSYNWAYPMVGANGAVLVDSNFDSKLDSAPVTETLDFLARLNNIPGMWIDNAPLENASQPEFTAGNVVFHNGQSWHLTASNKWGNANFDIDFVPYPKGPNVTENGAEYVVTHVYGKSSYAISSVYSKENVPAGYENTMIYDEIIFQIWNDLQVFPEIDPNTNQMKTDIYEDEFTNKVLMANYANDISIDAHLDIFSKARPDYFYSLAEAQGHVEGSYMLLLQDAIQNNKVREVIVALNREVQTKLDEKFKK